jgi:N6-adenosine-specific RNA methylase IME4
VTNSLHDLVGLSGFRCIVADPPWAMERSKGTLYAGATDTPPMKTIDLDYPVMTVDEIAALPVAGCAADGCHLYLWTTQRFLRAAYDVLDAWGFKQGAVLVWSKPPKGVCGTWVCSAEFCIFARRGTLAHKRRHIGTVFNWSRGRHSAKPGAFQDLVETVSPGPYLELFARPWTPLFEKRTGWEAWGNEIQANKQ